MDDDIKGMVRLPAGHPEGFLEAFANIYADFTKAFIAYKEGKVYNGAYPTVEDVVREMIFIEKVVESSKNNGAWTKVE